MQNPVEAASRLHQLRFVFKKSPPYLCFVPEVTSGDIARLWAEVSHRHAQAPIAIDLTLAPAAPLRGRNPGATLASDADVERGMGWLPTHLAWGAVGKG